MADQSIKLMAIPMRQPMGEFYVGVIKYGELLDISYVDMRKIEGDLDKYIGIQRKLNPARVRELGKFVNTIDATFPTSIVLAVPGKCYEYLDKEHMLILRENLSSDDGEPPVPFQEIAKVLDGQHRIEGLKEFHGKDFDIPVTIFPNADLADQAYIFATVNLAQTKVNRSLVYDLLDYAKSRSPQKTCHEVAVALNRHEKSPFKGMIKRLGNATPGQTGETLAQATFVMSLLPFITNDSITDRDRLLRGKSLPFPDVKEMNEMPFRGFFVKDNDGAIAKNVMEYFLAVSHKWPDDWASRDKGNMLPRTNGFRAFMRFLKNAYLHLKQKSGKGTFLEADYTELLAPVSIKSGGFDSKVFLPGTSGEKRLYDQLRQDTRI
ncbi:MAG: DGQHR domain-containing protein [Gammaproteobacteria bacterium]